MTRFRILMALAAVFLASSAFAESAPAKIVAPTGTLRVAIGVGPAASAFYSTKDPKTGEPHGPAVDLGAELARLLHVPVAYVEFPSSGAITDAADKNVWDVTFMPVDQQRAKSVDFGPNYYLFESTYLVPAGSKINTLADVDQPDVRVAGVTNTTTGRAAAASLKKAKLSTFRSVPELVDELRAGRTDAIALSRELLTNFSKKFPGSKILPGGFWHTGVAVAVPKGQAKRLAFVSTFIENAKATGSVRRALDNIGLKDSPVAPPAKRKK